MKNESIYLSVIMSVYTENPIWLRQSIESILNQTYKNFEFIIIYDDPSNKELLKILREYEINDKRIIIIENEKNIGLTASLNKGLAIAKGNYIARMDSDDISMPNRFALQIEKTNDNVVIGTQCSIIDSKQIVIGQTKFKRTSSKVAFSIRHMLPSLAHPSTIINTQVLRDIGGYDENFIVAQDYNLWCRIESQGTIINLPDKLLLLRKHSNNISYSKFHVALKNTIISNFLLHQKRIFPLSKNEYNELCISLENEVLYKMYLYLNKYKSNILITGISLILANLISLFMYLKYGKKNYD